MADLELEIGDVRWTGASPKSAVITVQTDGKKILYALLLTDEGVSFEEIVDGGT